jgi:hypothetical protein
MHSLILLALSIFLILAALIIVIACWAIGWSEQNFSDYDEPSDE